MGQDISVGIDLGTTYSCIAYIDENGEAVVDKNFEQEDNTPSVILFNEYGESIVGSPAKDMVLMYPPDRIVSAVKRQMGTDYSVVIDDVRYTAVTLSGMILKKMIKDFNENHCTELKKAVITCPAYFGQNERDATKAAGKVAGLEDVTIINEPTAAAISFGFGSIGEKKRVFVYDLGGGTFDVTVLDINGKSFTAVATDGERMLGGKDWDAALTRVIVRKIAEQTGMDESEIEADEEVRSCLEIDSENIKKRLSTAESTKGTITISGRKTVYTVTREEFENATRPQVERTLEIVARVLSLKGLTVSDIDAFLLVGGSSKMPMIADSMLRRFPGANIQVYDPNQSVAKGAAIFARSHNAVKHAMALAPKTPAAQPAADAPGIDAAPSPGLYVVDSSDAVPAAGIEMPAESISVHNVLSKSFGIKVVDESGWEYISNIIFRNKTLPISKVKEYTPMVDGQLSIRVEIYEDYAEDDEDGIRTDIVDATPVGEFEMELPGMVTRETTVAVRFMASDEGILSASADCMNQHKDYRLQSSTAMSDEEIAACKGLMEKVSRS